MLITLTDHFKPTRDLNYPHKGVVVDNEDPLRMGRVKCSIDGLFPDQENLPVGTATVDSDDPQIPDPLWQALPWCSPLTPAQLGGATNLGSFWVPEVGSELLIVFPYGDIYFPFYASYWQSESTHQGRHNTDYPNSYGFEDSTGFRWQINKARKTMEIRHPSGFAISVDGQGNVDFLSRGTIRFRDPQSQTAVEIDPQNGQITQKSPSAQRITSDLEVDNKNTTINSGAWDETLTGSKEVLVAGGHKLRMGGSQGIAVGADHNLVAGGNESRVIGGGASHVYGTGQSIVITLGDYVVETKLGSLELKNNLANLKIPVSGIAELNGILVKLQGGGQQALLGQDTVQWLVEHTHPTGTGPSGPPQNAPQALQLLSPKTWLS